MTTRACVLHAAHDLRIEEAPLAEPGAGEVLVRVGAGGICGSDLHYFHDGGFGPIRVREPIILGHEVAGTVEALGAGVDGLGVGDRVALNPSRPCNRCRYCLDGLQQHCLDMWFYGSAMRLPHSQGAFRDRIVAPAVQCEPVGAAVSLGEAACAEPLAVCLHALRNAGDVAGRIVLVTGSGPIGALMVAVLRFAGAGYIVVTDVQDAPLRTSAALGAHETANMAADAAALDRYAADKGAFDVAFECSSAPAAIEAGFDVVRPRGTFVQVGVGGDTAVPLNLLVSKEIVYRGTQRFHSEYPLAARLIRERRIEVGPLISQTFELEHALEAFEVAADRARAMKVQLTFD
ncbi:MAG: L-idonate 5-dehydrogenase [Pseudomonadota bacterium]